MLIKNSNSKSMAREAVVLDLGDLAAQGEVIKREAIASAERTLREARAERARIVAGAEEEGRKRGLAEGTARGLEEGRVTGRAEALASEAAALKAMQERWGKALDAFERERDAMLVEARSSVLRLAAAVARRVTKRAVDADALVVASQLETALRMVLAPTKLVIEVDESELEAAKRTAAGLMERLGGSQNAEVRGVAQLGKGSVIVKTDKGEIDASISVQLEHAVAALLGEEDAGGDPERAEPSSERSAKSSDAGVSGGGGGGDGGAA